MINPTVIHFQVRANTADETDRLIGERIRGYFGDRMNLAMNGPIIEQDTHETYVGRNAAGERLGVTFETDVTVTIEFLGYR